MVYTAILLGLLGSFHCVGMCGPIAFLLPLDRKNRTKRLLEIISYHSGRLLTYGFLGFLFGMLGQRIQLFGLQQQLSIAIGILMIVVILIPNSLFSRYKFSQPVYRGVSKLRHAIGLQLKRKEPGTFFTLGFLNGLLPCGLMYLAIFGAVGTGGMWSGALYMGCFGLGTVPLMTGAIYVGNFVKGSARKRIGKLVPLIVVVVGLLFILRGLGLGIPYISPSENVSIEQTVGKHNCH